MDHGPRSAWPTIVVSFFPFHPPNRSTLTLRGPWTTDHEARDSFPSISRTFVTFGAASRIWLLVVQDNVHRLERWTAILNLTLITQRHRQHQRQHHQIKLKALFDQMRVSELSPRFQVKTKLCTLMLGSILKRVLVGQTFTRLYETVIDTKWDD